MTGHQDGKVKKKNKKKNTFTSGQLMKNLFFNYYYLKVSLRLCVNVCSAATLPAGDYNIEVSQGEAITVDELLGEQHKVFTWTLLIFKTAHHKYGILQLKAQNNMKCFSPPQCFINSHLWLSKCAPVYKSRNPITSESCVCNHCSGCVKNRVKSLSSLVYFTPVPHVRQLSILEKYINR